MRPHQAPTCPALVVMATTAQRAHWSYRPRRASLWPGWLERQAASQNREKVWEEEQEKTF